MEERTLTDGISQICPLYAFKCTATGPKYLDLGEGVAIRRIPYDLQHYIDKSNNELALAKNRIDWVIQLPYNPSRRRKSNTGIPLSLSPFEKSADIVFDLIAALRLQHEGPVAPGPLLQLRISDGDFHLGDTVYGLRLSKSGYYSALAVAPYELHETDVEAFGEFWQDFQDKQQEGKLDDIKIALNRFNYSYGEVDEDRLLDQMIALENLYLGDTQELRYKFALRAAFLLADDAPARKKVIDRLKQAYDNRSTVVHGKKPRVTLTKLVADTEEYLRQSIKRFIELSSRYSLNELTEKILDQNILEAGQLLKAK